MIHFLLELLFRTLRWFDSHAGAVQAISALFVAILTGILVWLTRRYVQGTNDALALSRDRLELVREEAQEQKTALGLAKEQFEREWRPNLRIADIRFSAGNAKLLLANLAKSAALIKVLRIGTGGRARQKIQPQDVDSFAIAQLVSGGRIDDAVMIQTHLSKYRGDHNPPPMPPQRSQWQANMNIAVVYDCGKEEDVETQWFDCVVEFEDFTVTSVRRADNA